MALSGCMAAIFLTSTTEPPQKTPSGRYTCKPRQP